MGRQWRCECENHAVFVSRCAPFVHAPAAAATLRCCRAACAARRGSCRSRTSAATTQTHKAMSRRPQAAGPEGTAGSHLRHRRDVLHRKEGELRHAVVVLAVLRLVDAGAGARVHALHEEVRLRRVVKKSPHVPDRLIGHDAGSSQHSAPRREKRPRGRRTWPSTA